MAKLNMNAQRITQIAPEVKIIMDALPVGIIVFESDARIIYVNPLASKIFTKSAADISGLKCGDVIDCINRHKNSQGCGFTKSCIKCPLYCAISLSLSDELKEVLEEGEALLERDAGLSNIWVKYMVSSFKMENSKVAILTVENITERKQTEEALRKSEEYLRALSEASFDAIFLSEKGVCLGQNLTAQRLFGYSDQWALGRMGTEWIIPQDRAKVLRKMLTGDEKPYEVTALRKDGTTFAAQIQGKMMQFQGRPVRVTALRDISDLKKAESQSEAALEELRKYKVHLEELVDERTSDLRKSYIELKQEIAARKQAEEALFKSEEKYRKITENISDVVWVTDLNLKLIYVSPSIEKLFGESADVHISRTWEENFPPNSLEKIKSTFAEELEKEKDSPSDKSRTRTIESQHYRADGSTIWVSINVSLLRDENGNPLGIQGVARDITDRKEMEEKLRESKRFLETVFDSIQDGISVLDTQLNIVDANRQMKKWYSHMLPLKGKKCYEAYHQRSTPCEDCPTSRSLKTGKLEMVEHPLKQEDMDMGTIELYAYPMLDDTGKPRGVVEYIRNITDRKRAEAATRQAHQGLITILNSMDAGVYVADMETYELLFINQSTQKIHGNILGKKCWQTLHKNKSGPCEFCTNAKLLDAVGQPTGVYQWEHYNPKTGRWYECRDNALRWMDGRLVRLEIALDITDRKHAEEAIRESEQKYRTLFEETLNPILVVDENKKYIDANKAALEFLECDRKELLDRKVWYFAPPGKLDVMKQAHTPFFSRRMNETEYVVNRTIKTLMLNVVPLQIKGKTILYGIGQDITDRIKTEKLIKASLSEKDTLLKEIHHRVKNNMQVISSLLNLQIMRNTDEQARKALLDCQGRIGSMACVHEMLYYSANFSAIDCQAYISKLTNNILQSYQADLRRIKLTVDAEDITLGIQQASTLGLILNELLSNSLKYAFPNNKQGRIMIRLKTDGQKMMEFGFNDNGIGIPENLNWRNTKSLGLKLIVLLAENQLGGTISLEPGEGTCFTIKFSQEKSTMKHDD
jgi:PAS domain S-box-containing protein